MGRLRVALLGGLSILVGCATGRPVDPASTCRFIRDSPGLLDRASVGDLAELSTGTPAQSVGHSANDQRRSAIALGAIAAGALVAGLVTGFVADSAESPLRSAGYGLAGSAIGLVAVGLVLGYTSRTATERTRAWLRRWSENCP